MVAFVHQLVVGLLQFGIGCRVESLYIGTNEFIGHARALHQQDGTLVGSTQCLHAGHNALYDGVGSIQHVGHGIDNEGAGHQFGHDVEYTLVQFGQTHETEVEHRHTEGAAHDVGPSVARMGSRGALHHTAAVGNDAFLLFGHFNPLEGFGFGVRTHLQVAHTVE